MAKTSMQLAAELYSSFCDARPDQMGHPSFEKLDPVIRRAWQKVAIKATASVVIDMVYDEAPAPEKQGGGGGGGGEIIAVCVGRNHQVLPDGKRCACGVWGGLVGELKPGEKIP